MSLCRIDRLKEKKTDQRCVEKDHIQEVVKTLKERRDHLCERNEHLEPIRSTRSDTFSKPTILLSRSQSQNPSTSDRLDYIESQRRGGLKEYDMNMMDQIMAKNQEQMCNQVAEINQQFCKTLHETLRERSAETNIKLAIDYLGTFDGSDNSNFRQFYNMFKNTVMNNKDIGDDTKLAILSSKLADEPRRCVDVSDDPAVSLTRTLNHLEIAYGKNDTKKSLLNKFNSLKFNHADPKQMRIDLISHRNLAAQLCKKGLGDEDERITIAILQKLPSNMRTRVSDYYSKLESENRVSVELLYQFIFELVDSRQVEIEYSPQPQQHSIYKNGISDKFQSHRTAIAIHDNTHNYTEDDQHSYYEIESERDTNISQRNFTFHQSSQQHSPQLADNEADYPTSFKATSSGTTLPGYCRPGKGVRMSLIHRTFPLYDEKAKYPCNACGGAHNPIRCGLTSWDFRAMVEKFQLCPICTRTHPIEKCTSQSRCAYCGGLHHSGGCPQKEHFRDKRNYPSEARPILQFFRELRKPGNKGQANKTHAQ